MQNILIIGFGRVGSALHMALTEQGSIKLNIYDPQASESIAQCELTPKIVADTELIIISVADDAIPNAVRELTSFVLHQKTILHTSGMASLELLDPLAELGADTGVLHPLQSFSKRFSDSAVWKNIWCSFEGSKPAAQVAKELTGLLNAKFLQVNARQKQALHVAAVFTANYSIALFAAAEKILNDAGLNKNLLNPLIEQIYENFKTHPAGEILTGPLQRGDEQTIKSQLDFLSTAEYEPFKKLYRELAKFLLSSPEFKLNAKDQLLEILD